MARQIARVGATLTACGLMLGSTGVVASAATPQTAQANAALRYLYAQERADGSIAGSLGTTEDTVISVADNGYDPATLKSSASGTSAYRFIHGHATAINTAGGAAKYILTWVAAGKPVAIDASAVLTRLNTPTAAGGYLEANGAFHNANPRYEVANAYSQSLAVLADVAAGHSLPPHATGWLTCAQRVDGGFGLAIDDSAASPPPSCGGSPSDTNSTAITLEALGAAGVTSADAAAEGYLHSQQSASGGFAYNAGSPVDPNSDAGVIQGLVAIGQDPTGAAWTKGGGGNPMTDLESFADPNGGGGYAFTKGSNPDAFTTSAIPQALALKPYGAPTTIAAGTSPPAAATPTPRPSVPVPSTGSGGDIGGGAPWPLLLLAFGTLAGGAAIVRRRDPTAP